ncbi:uncharacterized protein LOC110608268 isoform X2 [Manihot esculenta]|uniref:Uncharacterized protein n=2 Tax=Manihot esculenta TaxID=3983 RepID=A0ACB7HSI3_MANES|nr:uncharacterized protein LOC110608268 isoform X2 [Manihot esculenta]KAG8655482.1 hypothetical protein MANES_04G040780v8 [Manihot esculenta]
MTDKGKEVEKRISLRSPIIKPCNISLLPSGQHSPRPIYTNTSSIITRPMNPISSALISTNLRPSFASTNRFSPLLSAPIPPSTFKQAVTGPTILSPSSSNPLPTQEPTQTEYSYKSIDEYILTIEPEYWAQNPNLNIYQLCSTIFPRNHYYIPDNFQKSQQFYETILINTCSIVIHNNYDPQNPNKLRYCKVRILKIWTLTDWGLEPHKMREMIMTIGQIKQNIKYNYYDYQIAWERTFFKQNEQLSVSFFFFFDDNFSYPLPYWFYQWWNKFGICEINIPSQITIAKEQFFERQQLPETITLAPSWLVYSHHFHIPWILMIEYQIKDQTIDIFQVPTLVRKFKTKWWNKTNLEGCGSKAIEQFFQDHPQFCKKSSIAIITRQETFLARKQQIMSQMAACTSEEEYDQLINELNEVRSSAASPSPISLDNDNADFFTQAEM